MDISFRMNVSRVLGLFVAGSVIGPALDQIHVRGKVLSYTHPTLLGQAWWVFPQYGLVTLLALFVAVPFVQRQPPLGRSIISDSACFVGAYFSTVLLKHIPVILTVLLVATWCLRVWFSTAPIRVLGYCILVSLAGTSYEAVLTHAHAFSYANPNFLDVPMWLPALYCYAAIFLLALTEVLVKSWRKGDLKISQTLRESTEKGQL